VHHSDEEEWEFGGDGEELLDPLNIGDNFVVLAEEDNAEEVEFYILHVRSQNSRSRNHSGACGDVSS
jgi:hypothetical protein